MCCEAPKQPKYKLDYRKFSTFEKYPDVAAGVKWDSQVANQWYDAGNT